MDEIWSRVASEDEIVNCTSSYAHCDSCRNREVCFALMTEMVLADQTRTEEEQQHEETTKIP